MRRAAIHHPFHKSHPISIQAKVTLTYDNRHRRRISLHDDNGEAFLLDLPYTVQLGDGDLLELESGGAIQVCAADEDVLDVTCDTIEATAIMAWHIGNRHIPIQVLSGGILRIRYDHVMEHMIMDNGGQCARKMAPFSPEQGTYHGHGGHAHHAHT